MSRMAHDDLADELSRLATRLTDDRAPITAELARVGQQVARTGDRLPPIRLAKLRLASPCQERWADMIGDDRVRICDRCDRPVFDLSAMTQAQAEAVLATRGITPCVRFYRRADGTVKTADCPSSKRIGVAAAAMAGAAVLASGGVASADDAPADPPAASADDPPVAPADAPPTELIQIEEPHLMGVPVMIRTATDITVEMGALVIEPERPTVEVSTWLGLGYGEASHATHTIARTITPLPTSERSGAWDAAAGADLSLGVARDGNLRLGAWGEARMSSGPVLGVELLVEGLPRRLSAGDGLVALRVGGNAHAVTTALAYGYHASWSYDHPRYTIGLRVVGAVTRSLDDRRDWTATAGIELEPLGVLRYVMHWFD